MEGSIASVIFSLQFKLVLRPKFDLETPFPNTSPVWCSKLY